MSVDTCRVCGSPFFPEALAHYENMPKAAQNFPSPQSAHAEAGAPLTVVQCTGCGLVQLSGLPVPYYREVIRAAAVSEALKSAKRAQFSELLEKYALHGGKIVEIGCGRGEFLSLFDPANVTAVGVEFSPTAQRDCEAKGLRVAKGYPGEAGESLPGGPFDAFFLLMFLEHMPDPVASLRAISRDLKEGGVGLVEVPNFEMILRENLFSEFIADHLLYFTRETLETTLNLAGFEILESGTLRDDYVISVVVKKRRRLDISGFRQAEVKLKRELHSFLDGFPLGRVAIWGAGHQSLAVIALSGIHARIPFVVDSAPFKQGKLTPGTHLPVVAPDFLSTERADAVIVIAGSYSDEIKGILERRFGARMKVAVLRQAGLDFS